MRLAWQVIRINDVVYPGHVAERCPITTSGRGMRAILHHDEYTLCLILSCDTDEIETRDAEYMAHIVQIADPVEFESSRPSLLAQLRVCSPHGVRL